MRQTVIIAGLTAMLPSTAQAWSVPALLDTRQSSSPYQDVVCKPQTGPGAQLPPCVQIENIELACTPNGTNPIDYEAHAQCICGGSFFAEKLACERCLTIHGLRSQRSLAFYSGVLSSASNSLCTGTPTAVFASIYSVIEAAATPVTTGATATSDQAPSNTAISLYYTATGPQGPGTITGAAASATAVASPTTTSPSATATGSASGGSGSSPTRASTATTGTASGAAATTTTAGSGAMPAYAAGGFLMGAAGFAVFAGL
ncbi:hypothetical protein CORC01_09330 [Colletotrichum orchidophilum]|uniref:Collagen-like protein Mcl1 n=1 Tax=Colletotrichum orchidophilum TaxID=1209926 RepID=A0A1G4B1L2_9PEZI|nr:uncharacterized protein CORC01_09330 [Colletotrichum orchidophilum]OHE95319.1 hypothetical protein CORC01_09330 [Colletotrichum orchidophilum]